MVVCVSPFDQHPGWPATTPLVIALAAAKLRGSRNGLAGQESPAAWNRPQSLKNPSFPLLRYNLIIIWHAPCISPWENGQVSFSTGLGLGSGLTSLAHLDQTSSSTVEARDSENDF